MPMKGLRRNDDAMKNQSWYQKNQTMKCIRVYQCNSWQNKEQ